MSFNMRVSKYAQLLVPEKLSILEDTFHYRLGEDAASLMFWGLKRLAVSQPVINIAPGAGGIF